MTEYRLSELIDMTLVQKLADSNFLATGLPMRIFDAYDLSILIEAGWQDICKNFHRAYPFSNKRCRESDDEVKTHLADKDICQYRCKNGLWHIAIPIKIAGQHMATMFLSQFYFEGEVPDREYFIRQASEFDYDLDSYLDALDRLPVFTVDKVSYISAYNKAFARFIADLAENSLQVIETKKSLQESEERYRSLINNVNIGIFRTTSEGRFIQANPAMVKKFGYDSEEELLGIQATELYQDPEDRKKFVKELQQKGVKERVLAMIKKDGTPIWCSVSATLHHDATGSILWIDGVIEDITMRNKAEIALVEQKEFSQNLLQNSAAAIFVLDCEHRVVVWNRACEELTGIIAADIVGTDEQWKAFYDHQRPVLADLILDGKQGELPHLYNNYSKSKFIPEGFQAEKWFKDIKGVERYIYFNAAPIRNGSGEIIAVIETLEDLTEMKLAENKLIEAEEALKESESKFKIISEQALIGIFMHQDGLFNYVNPKFAEIFGYSVDECIGAMIFQNFIYPEDIPIVEDQIKRRLSGENHTSHYQFRGLTKQKEIVYLELYGSTTIYNKKTVSIGTLLDISDRKKAEVEKIKLEDQFRQAQKMEAVGTLAGGIAHDFNNILMAMTGYCTLIERKIDKDSPVNGYLDKLVTLTDRAASLIKSLLTYSRKQSLNAQHVDLNTIVKKVEDLLLRLLGEDIELASNLSEGPLTVMADSMQIEQVLMNLSTNARDAMLQGGILKISTSRLELGPEFIKTNGYGIPGSYALMTVSDSGSGMDETTRGRIFEPFFTTKEVNKGTGLGLSIVFGIIKQHNGYVNVYSEPGKGTTFNIYLPLSEQVESNRQTMDLAEPLNGSETILLVEDDEKIRSTLKELLEGNGYTIFEAVDGDDGIKLFLEFKDDIDLIILDMIMPKKNGKIAFDEMKSIRPGIRSIFLSGYSADILDSKGILQEGMNFIHKPVVINDLLLKIREVLDKPQSP